jgi:hypothetical protein
LWIESGYDIKNLKGETDEEDNRER